MNWKRKSTALLLAGALAVAAAGCTGGEAPAADVAMGRYIETEWELPLDDISYMSAMHKRPDGRFGMLLHLGDEGQRYYSTSNGSDWLEETLPWVEQLSEDEQYVMDISYNNNGEVALLCNGISPETGRYGYFVATVDADGNLSRTPIGEADKARGDNMFRNFNVPGDDVEGEKETPDANDTENPGTPIDDAPEAPATATASASAATVADDSGESGEGEDEDGEDEDDPYAWDPDAFYARYLILGDDGLVYVDDYNTVTSYNPGDGAIVQQFPSTQPRPVLLDGQLVTAAGPGYYTEEEFEENTLLFYDLVDGRELRRLPCENMVGYGGDVLGAGSDGSLLLVNEKGIYRLVPGGDVWERIADGALNSLSLPNSTIVSVDTIGEDEYLVQLYTDDPRLIHYRYDPDTPTRPSTELTVYAMRDFPTVKQGIGAFRQKYPDVLVNFSVPLEDGSASGDDMLRVWNTELLAGKGPDIMVLDQREDVIESYAEKGVLADLSEMLQPMIDSGELYGGVVRSFERDGKIYAVPTRFGVPTLWGDPEFISAAVSLEAIVEYMEAHPEERFLQDMRPSSLAAIFLPVSQAGWFDADGQLNTEEVARFLELIRRLSATAEVKESLMGDDWDIEYNMSVQDLVGFEELYNFSVGNTLALPYYLNGFETVTAPNGVLFARNGGDVDISEETSVSDSEMATMFRLLSGQREGSFIPTNIVGVNDASEHKELAMEFVKTLMGETVQNTDLSDGFPVNKAANAHNVEREENMWMSWGWSDSETGVQMMITMGWPSHGAMQAVVDTFDRLHSPVMLDESLLYAVREHGEEFFEGSGSALEVAEDIAGSMRLQLSE